MLQPRITIRPVNDETAQLPRRTEDRDLLLFRVVGTAVVETVLFHHYPTCSGASVHGYTHYALLPRQIWEESA